jgi:hypothetical protein
MEANRKMRGLLNGVHSCETWGSSLARFLLELKFVSKIFLVSNIGTTSFDSVLNGFKSWGKVYLGFLSYLKLQHLIGVSAG